MLLESSISVLLLPYVYIFPWIFMYWLLLLVGRMSGVHGMKFCFGSVIDLLVVADPSGRREFA